MTGQHHDIENGGCSETDHKERNSNVTILDWRTWIIERFNWSFFTCTQSTGGIAIALSECPKQFPGLQTIGIVIFLFNLVLLTLFTALITSRFLLRPSLLRPSLTKPPECFFFPSFYLSLATIIICTSRFALPHCGPWLPPTLRITFYIYASLTLLSSILHLAFITRSPSLPALSLPPPLFLTIFNAMLTGTVAASIAASQPPAHRLPIIVTGITFQGLGWIVSLLFFPWYLGNLVQNGWPEPSQRPGLFMPIGSVGYTVVALIGCARALPVDEPYFLAHPAAAEILLVVATWASVFLWAFAFWIFGLAAVISLAGILERDERGVWRRSGMGFRNSWWGMIFPNVGFAVGTVFVGQELGSEGVLWVGTGMIVALVLAWLMDLVLLGKGVYVSLFRDGRVKLS
ncbi:Voltage-dependent anion channel-like protein 2 [Elsinoe fawcettii]|nr:Voltage-dependent anion channel-like protein 2 [Elsinoe fawcettii]